MRSSRLASFRIFSLLLILLLTFFAANMIAYATDEHRSAPWRLAAADSRSLSQPGSLRPRG